MSTDPGKVAVYIRWSTDDQSSGTTLEVQRERCLHYALSQGLGAIPPDQIFIDEGYSGGDMKRPGITKIRSLVKQGKLHVVVVYKIDRLSRNIVDAVDLVLREWEGVCRLACVSEPVDTSTDLGRMFFNTLAMFADFERSAIRNRTSSGKLRRAQEGRNPGVNLPYGYRSGPTPGTVEIDEVQAATVRRIFEMYATGMGGISITQILNNEGVRTARGSRWANNTIRKFISNPAYTGKFIYGKTRTNPRYGKDVGAKRYVARDEPLAVTDMFPPIIDEVTFQRCHENRTTKAQSGKGRVHTSPYLLTGIARCRCGEPLHGMTYPNRKGVPWFRYYKCSGKSNHGAATCNSGNIPVDMLDALVLQKVQRLLLPENQERLYQSARQRSTEAVSDLEVRLADADAELANLDAQEKRATRDYKTAKLPVELFTEIRKDIVAVREATAANRATLRAELEKMRGAVDDHRMMERKLAEVQAWDSLSLPERKQLLAALVKRVTAYRAKRTKDELELSVAMWEL